MQEVNPPIHQWCGQIQGNIHYPCSLTLQGGNTPIKPIPQWSDEVLESNQYFWNQLAIPTFDLDRPPHGPHSNGMMGSVNNLEKITHQMGQMPV